MPQPDQALEPEKHKMNITSQTLAIIARMLCGNHLKFLFQNKIISGTNRLKISLPWAKSVLVLSATGTWSLGFDAAREHATHNQSILPLIAAKR